MCIRDSLHALGEVRDLPRLCVASLAEQVRMHALRSHADACTELIGRLERFTTPKAYKRWGMLGSLVKLQAGLARAYAAMVAQDWKRMLAELDASKPVAEKLRRTRDGIQINLLQALALKRCGEDSQALFSEAISMAESLGLERILVDTHPDLIDWVRRIRGGSEAAAAFIAPRPEVRQGGDKLPAARPAARATASLSALLTPKEAEVLSLIHI